MLFLLKIGWILVQSCEWVAAGLWICEETTVDEKLLEVLNDLDLRRQNMASKC